MNKDNFQGKVTSIFRDEISTDHIIPAGRLLGTWEGRVVAKYAFEKHDPLFVDRCEEGPNVIVAGPNFGCGSSREQAIDALIYNNVKFVIVQKNPKTGKAFPDIIYRNALDNALPLIAVDDISGIQMGDELRLSLKEKKVYNLTKNTTYSFEMPEYDIDHLVRGGSTPLAKRDLRKRLEMQEQLQDIKNEGLIVCHPNRGGKEIDDLALLIEQYNGPVIVIQHPDDMEYPTRRRQVKRITSQDCISFEGDGKTILETFLRQIERARVVGHYISEINDTKLCVDRVLEFCQRVAPQAYADTKYCIPLRPK